jgi:alkanesulfonate monooxygenase SsuD/methylene tetrahydromethanopterin reductase-like flavin-dependent oxidoreductase (luciferase family)
MALEAVGQIVEMMVTTPYPGFSGESFSMPCRNVLPKPLQKPHPPLWIACTNRDTIKLAARLGVGALAFSFIDPEEARTWVSTYYDLIKSEECVPLGHAVNANIALVAGFSLHHDRAEAVRRGVEGFEFFGYALNALVAHDTVPGRTDLWGEFQASVADRVAQRVDEALAAGDAYSSGIGAPADVARHLTGLAEAGVDQVIFLQQAGRNRHRDICDSLELFAAEVMPQFQAGEAERVATKERELRPFIEAALLRRPPVRQMEIEEIPVVAASVKKAEVGGGPA